MFSSSEYIEKAIVDIQQEAVLQLEGLMVSQFLTVKIQNVKNCDIGLNDSDRFFYNRIS
jgi:hypothetical protein